MKDITRIHIAKVPYNIELSAKKELEEYIATLETYATDSELLMDIEIRMTELLLERGVKQDDVISVSDIAAIRQQLGEPREFMTDETAIGVEKNTKETTRKLYRNLDNAILGGVLGGVASYFKINVLWVRLAYIVLIFMSFGLFVLLYVVGWLIIPPARTAAEKLQMAGRPITLSSIREISELEMSKDTQRRLATIRRVMTLLLGIACLFGAIASIGIMAIVAGALLRVDATSSWQSVAPYQISLALMFVGGVLLAILFLLVAFAAFAQKFNKQILISGVIIIVLGLASVGASTVIGVYQQRSIHEEIQRNMVETDVKLPESFKSIKNIAVDIPNAASLVYIVDDRATSLTQRTLKGSPVVQVSVENGTAKISLKKMSTEYNAIESTMTIHGPSLESIVSDNGDISYDTNAQTSLRIEARNNSSVFLEESRIDSLDIKTDDTARIEAESAAVPEVKAVLRDNSTISLGSIKTLSVTGPEACASNATATLNVWNIFSTTYDYNGEQTMSHPMSTTCFEVNITGKNSENDHHYN